MEEAAQKIINPQKRCYKRFTTKFVATVAKIEDLPLENLIDTCERFHASFMSDNYEEMDKAIGESLSHLASYTEVMPIGIAPVSKKSKLDVEKSLTCARSLLREANALPRCNASKIHSAWDYYLRSMVDYKIKHASKGHPLIRGATLSCHVQEDSEEILHSGPGPHSVNDTIGVSKVKEERNIDLLTL
jgi:hypothetical protein